MDATLSLNETLMSEPALHYLGLTDYIVFAAMLLVCAAIGIYFGFFQGDVSQDDYLVGGRSMGTFPVSMSLIASMFSGVTLLGTPTEIYLRGTEYAYVSVAILLMGFLMAYLYLPVFHDLRITSTYEYLEMRFDKRARIFGSFLFAISVIRLLPIVIYVPALAFNQVTGIDIHLITPVVCVICIFYTCVGGIKAVVWTDVVQTLMMFGAMTLVVIKATIDVGGFGVVWERNMASGRIDPPNLSMDLTTRHALLALTVGGSVHWLADGGVQQSMAQRYFSLPTLRAAKNAVWIFVFGSLGLVLCCCYCGLLIFAIYHDCDPLTSKMVKAKDQLLPLLVVDTLSEVPGLTGLFVAGVFSAALSSMSTALNSMSAVALEDFFRSWSRRQLTARQTDVFMKAVVVVTGAVCTALVFVVEKLGAVLQLTLSLASISYGPSLGIFTAGIFFPWINATGAIVGASAGLLVMAWIIVGTQVNIAAGAITIIGKSVTTEGCLHHFIAVNNTAVETPGSAPDAMTLYLVSYMWYTLIGCTVTVVVGLLVSLVPRTGDGADVDPRLVSPFVRRFLSDDRARRSDNDCDEVPRGYKAFELKIIPDGGNTKCEEG